MQLPVNPELLGRRWRRQEAFLLSAVVVMMAVGLAAVDLSTVEHIQATSIRVFASVAVCAVIIAITMRMRARYADPFISPIALMLLGIGLIQIHRLDIAEQIQAITTAQPVPTSRAPMQALWAVIGVLALAAVLMAVREHRRLQRLTWTITLAGLAMLLLPLVPGLGRTIRGATLWVSIGGFSIQPAETAKVLLTIGFSAYLTRYGRALALLRARVAGIAVPRPRDFIPLLLIWLVSLGVLILQRDLGTSLLFFGLFVVVLYASTGQRLWAILGLAMFLTGSMIGWLLFSHVQVRVDLWANPFRGDGTSQVALGLYGIADGGLFGSGLGQGFPSLVPFAESDFIFASISEELGLAGSIACLLLYALLVQRGLRTAMQLRDTFGSLLAMSLATVIALQTFVVIGGVTRLIPLTGLTTPFLSYGGSSLASNFIVIALLLRLSHAAREPRPEFKQTTFTTGPQPTTSPDEQTQAFTPVSDPS